jgi:hypothetical protein
MASMEPIDMAAARRPSVAPVGLLYAEYTDELDAFLADYGSGTYNHSKILWTPTHSSGNRHTLE